MNVSHYLHEHQLIAKQDLPNHLVPGPGRLRLGTFLRVYCHLTTPSTDF